MSKIRLYVFDISFIQYFACTRTELNILIFRISSGSPTHKALALDTYSLQFQTKSKIHSVNLERIIEKRKTNDKF